LSIVGNLDLKTGPLASLTSEVGRVFMADAFNRHGGVHIENATFDGGPVVRPRRNPEFNGRARALPGRRNKAV